MLTCTIYSLLNDLAHQVGNTHVSYHGELYDIPRGVTKIKA